MHHTDCIEDGYLGSGKALKRAVKKYGKENFRREILEYADSLEHLNELEKKYVTLNEVNDDLCYNLKTGGENGQIYSDEVKEKIRMAQKGKPRGPMSEEHKRKISEANKGKKKIRIKPPWNKGMKTPNDVKEKIRQSKLGTKCSEETKQKIRETHNHLKNNPEYIKHLSDGVKAWWHKRANLL